MTVKTVRRYRSSAKREQTREQNRARILAAAWEIFCTDGLDAANIRDIVKRSAVSQGTFYNYFGTKEEVFEILAQELLERIRKENESSRAGASTLEEMIRAGYRSYLSVIQQTPRGREFIDRNQHHIRALVQRSTAISGLAADVKQDLRRFPPASSMSEQDRGMAASLMVAIAAEAVLVRQGQEGSGPDSLADFLTAFVLHGISGMAGESPASGRSRRKR